MRKITTHEVNGLNEALRVTAIDKPGQGNACHEYLIDYDPMPGQLLSSTRCFINFQNGPIAEVGVNGLSNESLLSVVRDRLEGFQSGPFACESNQAALDLLVATMNALHSRTKERLARGVEGTHKV